MKKIALMLLATLPIIAQGILERELHPTLRKKVAVYDSVTISGGILTFWQGGSMLQVSADTAFSVSDTTYKLVFGDTSLTLGPAVGGSGWENTIKKHGIFNFIRELRMLPIEVIGLKPNPTVNQWDSTYAKYNTQLMMQIAADTLFARTTINNFYFGPHDYSFDWYGDEGDTTVFGARYCFVLGTGMNIVGFGSGNVAGGANTTFRMPPDTSLGPGEKGMLFCGREDTSDVNEVGWHHWVKLTGFAIDMNSNWGGFVFHAGENGFVDDISFMAIGRNGFGLMATSPAASATMTVGRIAAFPRAGETGARAFWNYNSSGDIQIGKISGDNLRYWVHIEETGAPKVSVDWIKTERSVVDDSARVIMIEGNQGLASSSGAVTIGLIRGSAAGGVGGALFELKNAPNLKFDIHNYRTAFYDRIGIIGSDTLLGSNMPVPSNDGGQTSVSIHTKGDLFLGNVGYGGNTGLYVFPEQNMSGESYQTIDFRRASDSALVFSNYYNDFSFTDSSGAEILGYADEADLLSLRKPLRFPGGLIADTLISNGCYVEIYNRATNLWYQLPLAGGDSVYSWDNITATTLGGGPGVQPWSPESLWVAPTVDSFHVRVDDDTGWVATTPINIAHADTNSRFTVSFDYVPVQGDSVRFSIGGSRAAPSTEVSTLNPGGTPIGLKQGEYVYITQKGHYCYVAEFSPGNTGVDLDTTWVPQWGISDNNGLPNEWKINNIRFAVIRPEQSPALPLSQVDTSSIDSTHIKDGGIAWDDLSPQAQDSTTTTGSPGLNTVDSTHIKDGGVAGVDFSSSAIDTIEAHAGGGSLGPNTVDSTHIKDASVAGADLAPSAKDSMAVIAQSQPGNFADSVTVSNVGGVWKWEVNTGNGHFELYKDDVLQGYHDENGNWIDANPN